MHKFELNKLLWLDLELTGLDLETDQILQLAAIITDQNLNTIAEMEELVISTPIERLEMMDDWNREHHTESGLWQAALDSNLNLEVAEQKLVEFIQQYFDTQEETPVVSGNSVYMDKYFITKYMPAANGLLDYRLVDVSTIKQLAFAWYPDLPRFEKQKTHTALADIKESIAELKYYQLRIFK